MAFELHPAQPVALITFAQYSCPSDSRSPVSQRDLRALLLGTLVLPFSLSDLLLVLWTQVKNNLSRVVSLTQFHAGAFPLLYCWYHIYDIVFHLHIHLLKERTSL